MIEEFIKEVPWNEEVGTATFVYKREFMIMEHNYLCAVCRVKHAVADTSKGILQPCWGCQGRGYQVYRFGKFARWLVENLL